MKSFIIEEDFWSLFPDSRIGVIVCRDIDNTPHNEDLYQTLLQEAEKKALAYLEEDEFSKNQVIHVWREAFQQFKTKKGARSSIEALLKRVHSGKHIGIINPLVDLYNAISLKYALPCGGEDIDTFIGNLRLTKARGDEPFVTLGTDENAPPHEGEIVYKDDAGAVCRCWNWRESVRTMLTENTRNAFLCIELVDKTRVTDLEDALNELAELVRRHLGGTCSVTVLDIHHQQTVIE